MKLCIRSNETKINFIATGAESLLISFPEAIKAIAINHAFRIIDDTILSLLLYL